MSEILVIRMPWKAIRYQQFTYLGIVVNLAFALLIPFVVLKWYPILTTILVQSFMISLGIIYAIISAQRLRSDFECLTFDTPSYRLITANISSQSSPRKLHRFFLGHTLTAFWLGPSLSGTVILDLVFGLPLPLIPLVFYIGSFFGLAIFSLMMVYSASRIT